MNFQGATSSWLSTDNTRKYSPNGLLLRYARGRVRHFVHRQIYAFTGALFLWVIISPTVGLLAFALTVLGDALDCFFLRRLPQLLDQGWSTRRLQIVRAMTAGISATAISFTVNMHVYFHPDQAAVSYTHILADETVLHIVCRLLLHKKNSLFIYFTTNKNN